jgi:hypothetical protein
MSDEQDRSEPPEQDHSEPHAAIDGEILHIVVGDINAGNVAAGSGARAWFASDVTDEAQPPLPKEAGLFAAIPPWIAPVESTPATGSEPAADE